MVIYVRSLGSKKKKKILIKCLQIIVSLKDPGALDGYLQFYLYSQVFLQFAAEDNSIMRGCYTLSIFQYLVWYILLYISMLCEGISGNFWCNNTLAYFSNVLIVFTATIKSDLFENQLYLELFFLIFQVANHEWLCTLVQTYIYMKYKMQPSQLSFPFNKISNK